MEMKKPRATGVNTIEDANLVLANFANKYDLYQPFTGISKAIMYMGFFWRHIQAGNVIIGKEDKSTIVGFMQRNVWGYKERKLTKVEELQLILFADELDYTKVESYQAQILKKLNEWMQSLTI